MDFYQEDQIFELSSKAGAEGKINISVRPELETLYFLSGAIVEERNDYNAIKLVKCTLKEKCNVDYEAQPVESDPGLYVLEIDEKQKDYVFDLGNGLRRLDDEIAFSE